MSNIDNYIEDKDVFFNAENWEVVTTSNVENENLNDEFLDVLYFKAMHKFNVYLSVSIPQNKILYK